MAVEPDYGTRLRFFRSQEDDGQFRLVSFYRSVTEQAESLPIAVALGSLLFLEGHLGKPLANHGIHGAADHLAIFFKSRPTVRRQGRHLPPGVVSQQLQQFSLEIGTAGRSRMFVVPNGELFFASSD